jgi:hypothetical protein
MAIGKKTGGRKKGQTNIKTREIAEKAIAKGITPLEVMLELMRDLYDAAVKETVPSLSRALKKEAAEVAKDAAPYLHPKLQPVDGRGSTDMNVNVYVRKLAE